MSAMPEPAPIATPTGGPSLERFDGAEGGTLCFARAGTPEAPLRLVWLHGWGQDHRAFAALAGFFDREAESLLVDFPGFGAAPPPPGPWGTEDYGVLLAQFLKSLPPKPTILIGHSFGCRVSIRLASAEPGLVRGLALLAAAGLRRKRSLRQRLRAQALKFLGRAARALDRLGSFGLYDAYAGRFGSADYRNAGPMRATLVRTVNEDLTEPARGLNLPVLLVFGEDDTETPPEFGRRYEALMENAELLVLPGFDHYTVLGPSAHQAKSALARFVRKLTPGAEAGTP